MFYLILTRLVFFLSIPLCLYGVYFAFVALLGLRRSAFSPIPQTAPQKRFALVVAARNEEAVIGNLVDSLSAQEYPRELFEIIVAPNNCTDNTEAVAAAHGARIFRPEGTIRSKGEVLRQVVEKVIFREDFDAMCVFDADNLVDRHFLAHMNDALCDGAEAVQGFRDSKNPEQNAVSGVSSIGYWMMNCFYNAARSNLKLSALISGCGFAVSAQLLRRLGGWHTVTMTEDYEFSAQCAMVGERVRFVQDAVFYDEQPLTLSQSWKQRRRWTTGELQGMQRYGFGLFSGFVLHGSVVCLDMFLTFLVPLVQLLGTVVSAISVVLVFMGGGIVLGGVVIHGLIAAVLAVLVSAVMSILSSAFLAALTVLLKNRPLAGMAKGILSYWLFIASHVVLALLSFVKKQENWEPIAHTSAKRIEDM